MKTIYLLRHSKAEKNLYYNDIDRPLTLRGENDAAKIGDYFKAKKYALDLIYCSPALRTKQTLENFLKAAKLKKNNTNLQIQYIDKLYNDGFYTTRELIKNTDDKINYIMFIGHCPDIQDIADYFSELGFFYEKFNTSGLCVLQFSVNKWSDINSKSGKLLEYISPKKIEKLL